MRAPMTHLNSVNRHLYARSTRGWPAARLDGYVHGLGTHVEGGSVPDVVARTFQAIDGKAAALLTHTSMMVAALGVSATVVAQSRPEQAIIIEISAYLLIAMFSLRCLWLFGEGRDADDLSEAIHKDLILRRGIYTLCNRRTIYLTVMVFITLPLFFLYVPA